MWQDFVVLINHDTIQLEFPEVPTPLLKLLQAESAPFTSSNNNLKWECPNDATWLGRISSLARKYNGKIHDLRESPDVEEAVQTKVPAVINKQIESISSTSIENVLAELASLRQEVVELKKFDAIASEKLSELKLNLESGRQKTKSSQKSSKRNGKTKLLS